MSGPNEDNAPSHAQVPPFHFHNLIAKVNRIDLICVVENFSFFEVAQGKLKMIDNLHDPGYNVFNLFCTVVN